MSQRQTDVFAYRLDIVLFHRLGSILREESGKTYPSIPVSFRSSAKLPPTHL